MSTSSLLGELAKIHAILEEAGLSHALVGGLAVSVRAEPRATRDVDLVVDVASDPEAEQLVRRLAGHGYPLTALVEQDAVGRLATARLTSPGGVVVDLLFASCGIEPEIVQRADTVEIDDGISIPVAQAEELLAMKVLSMKPRREQDALDARLLMTRAC